jgi:superfamily I DNA/RNA helicase
LHFHALARDIIRECGRIGELPDADESYLNEVAIPELAFECIVGSHYEGRYDALVIDEAQDLMRTEYLVTLSALLRGGLEGGRWRAFLDPKQNAFGGIAAPLRDLEQLGAFPYRLTRNCRNTEPIATTTALLSGVDLEETLVCDGPTVEEVEYVDDADQRRKLARVLNRLLGDGFRPESITVLSRYRLENSCLRVPLNPTGPAIRDGAAGVGTIGFSTTAGFKGLESDVVVLVDVNDLSSPDALRSVYLGASRAQTVLVVMRDVRTNEDRMSLAYEFGERLSRAATS